ncbi:MAG: efflux RND transporter permease subunit [Phycisphaerae bacterium]|nr:efflux RND transporter permease subunit [Phycisphaerae bacterium]
MSENYELQTPQQRSLIGKLMRWCMENKLVVGLVVLFVVAMGVMYAPFDWNVGGLQRYPIATDAIPDIGENQQIIFTEWMGRSPQDVEDQISYPLTVALQGIPNVRTIRSYSMFGFSTIYVIFEERMDFYDARTRILEKLGSLRPGKDYPDGTRPQLGPDSTALGQIFWYTLEGRDPDGKPIGGWDLEELRTIQDWYVRYSLLSARGVSEVASVGGFVREYQIDVDPDAMRAYGVTLPEIYAAVKNANIDVGAKTIELNNVEYFVRGIGFIKNVEDIETSVIKVRDNVPILIEHVATVTLGPGMRRGVLDKDGAEAVGGVVVARYGDNPLAVIKNVKNKIAKLAPGLATKVILRDDTPKTEIETYAQKHGFPAYLNGELNQAAWLKYLQTTPRKNWPGWANTSQVTIVPFYDRTGLIYETLGTLSSALTEEILITFIVVIIMVMHLRASVLIGGMLPLSVLLCFIAMKLFGIDANIVALSGIAIAIGTIVDMGIVVCENILKRLAEAPPDAPRLEVVHRAASEVGSAVLTAVATTVVSFLPVFMMIGAEGKLFRPLAFTKTFALIASIIIALTILPAAAHVVFCGRISGKKLRDTLLTGLLTAGLVLVGYGLYRTSFMISASGIAMLLFGLYRIFQQNIPHRFIKFGPMAASIVVVFLVGVGLTIHWEPLGVQRGVVRNFLFVAILVGGLLGFFKLFEKMYPRILQWCLGHKTTFISIVGLILLFGVTAWLGFGKVFSFIPATVEAVGGDAKTVRSYDYWVGASNRFPGLGKEFMPDLDEGSFLYMPTTMTHASIGEVMDILSKQDTAFSNIPEIDSVVGKLGRAETPLDPAPVSMIETVINYKPEYITDQNGKRLKFKLAGKNRQHKTDGTGDHFAIDGSGELVPDSGGQPFRQWRAHIRNPDDIWDEIVAAGEIPGTTSAPKLMPIKARIVMLQSGMRAPMGVKIKGPDLETIERVGLQIERLLKEVPGVEPNAVIADRIIGKPYLEIVPNRDDLARYGVKMREFQDIIEIAIGGKTITQTVEGRERFGVRVRYQRELRDSIETLGKILIPGKNGTQIPLTELAEIKYVRGPQVIKSEDSFLTGYVLFDKKPNQAEVDVVERAKAYLEQKQQSGELSLPPGVNYTFAGNYENQIRSQKKLMFVLPLALFVIFLILYFQFKRVSTTLLVFSGIFVAWSGGFILLWMYGQGWFMDFSVFGMDMRELFQVHAMNLSVAVWVGFLALFGIATDNGVIQSTYLDQVFRERKPDTIDDARDATMAAAKRRIRPCLMTSATTILALIPVLTSVGRGSDVMVPMAIPSFGGMLVVMLSAFIVPVLYCWIEEAKLNRQRET